MNEEPSGRKAIGAFYTTPGRRLVMSLGSGPIRGEHVTAGVLYVVSGEEVYAVTSDLTATLLGTLRTSSGPLSIIDNGVQTAFFDGNTLANVLEATITAAGSGGTDGIYNLPLPAPGSEGIQATGTFTITSGSLSDVTLTNAGSAYTTDSTITNAQLAAVGGVGALAGAEIALTAGGGLAYIVSPQYMAATAVVAALGGSVGHSYVPGDTVTLGGGKFLSPAVLTINSTQVFSSSSGSPITGIGITSGGTGYPFDTLVAGVAGVGGSGTGATFTVGTWRSGTASVVTSVSVQNGGTGYVYGDVLSLEFLGGTGCTVTVTQVGAGITNPGAGGTPGNYTFTGTTGTGTKFQIEGTVGTLGILSELGTVTVPGDYTVNPSDLSAEPITGGGGLTGATISIVMSPLTATVTTPGAYIAKPDDPVAQAGSSGAGLGATWLLTWAGGAEAFSLLSMPFSGATTAAYQDGLGLVSQTGTQQFFQSDLDDLATWNPLNFSSADAQPDDIQALADVHREVWVIKEFTAEIWINGGLAGFAFQRLDGVFIEVGCIAPFSVARAGESLLWLSQSKEGQGVVVITSGYNIIPVSTHALQYAFEQYETLADAIGYAYQQEGHLFYVLTFPTANASWCYDVTSSRALGQPCWHERPYFNGGALERLRDNCHATFNNENLVGDYANGNIYALDLETQTDNGVQRKWLRTWRALPQPVDVPVTFDSLQIDMQTGINVPDGTDPRVVLRWSDDGGHNWSSERNASAGKTGETAARVKFNRLGSTKRNSGLDRIFELSSTDPFATALIGAILE